MKRLLQGNAAVARGAWEAGVAVAAGYPGTPSTEILEHLALMPDLYAEWSPNEKVALDVAIGAAYAGKRSMAVMKHVGLNVAADSLFYASLTGLQAGLVLVVADDPGMHSSQNEQDSRRYASFARVPCLEPSDSQEAKDMVALALQLSEHYDTPVMLRMTTRISHSYSLVEPGPERVSPVGQDDYVMNPQKYVMAPANARLRRPAQEERVASMTVDANTMTVNQVFYNSRSTGIITGGAAYQYAREAMPGASFFKLGMPYPFPAEAVKQFCQQVERVIVIEELDPVIEEELKYLGISCEGKSLFPSLGEFDPSVIRLGLAKAGLSDNPLMQRPEPVKGLPMRPPVLCPGCPHRGIFTVMRKLKLIVNGDIGCYTLGAMTPLNALHTCGCMGASIGVAHGVKKAGIRQTNVALIGDSTFFHTGMPALLNAAYNQGQVITVILDNRTTAMTGHQQNPGTGFTLQRKAAPVIALEPLVRALGIQHVYKVDPYNLADTEAVFRECLQLQEPSVVIAEHPCALLPEERQRYQPLHVDLDKCVACGACRKVGCPAIILSDMVYTKTGRQKTQIDPLLCTGCKICAQVCPRDAILTRRQANNVTDET